MPYSRPPLSRDHHVNVSPHVVDHVQQRCLISHKQLQLQPNPPTPHPICLKPLEVPTSAQTSPSSACWKSSKSDAELSTSRRAGRLHTYVRAVNAHSAHMRQHLFGDAVAPQLVAWHHCLDADTELRPLHGLLEFGVAGCDSVAICRWICP